MKTVLFRATAFLFLILSVLEMKGQVFKVDTLIYNAAPHKRINLVILGDGYRTADTAKFTSDALSVASYFLNTPPFNQYRNFFNFFSIKVISVEAGNDHPGTANDEPGGHPVTSVNNYLESTFDYGGTHRCVYSANTGLVFSILNANFPQYDVANVIVNTSYYGGCGGSVAFTSMNSASPETFVHEFGHSFAGLADEYEYGSPCNPGSMQRYNVSQQEDTSLLVWKNWLTTAPIPTTNGTNCNLIGLYEGSNYCSTNWYRPKCDCKMRSLNVPFCEVCTERFISKMDSLVNLIDDYFPKKGSLTICKNVTQVFSVTQVKTIPNTICTSWFVDNVAVAGNDTAFAFDASLFSIGTHTVKAINSDTTTEVKKALATWQRVWTLSVVEPKNGIAFVQSGNLLISPFTNSNWFMTGDSVSAGATDTLAITQDGNYYVTGIDNNGCPATSDTIFISGSWKGTADIVIMPNPFNEEVHIAAHGISSDVVQIMVNNVLGQAMYKTEVNVTGNSFSMNINTRKFGAGLYFLVFNGGDFHEVRKIMKE
jgi:hypothetical protein